MAVTDNAGIGLTMGMSQLSLSRNYPMIAMEAKENGHPDQLYDPHHATPLLEQQGQAQQQFDQQLQQQAQGQQHQSYNHQHPNQQHGNPSGVAQNQQQVASSSGVQHAGRANGMNGHVKAESAGDDEELRSNGSNNSMRELEDLLTKLNPLAKEFVPPSLTDASATATSSGASSKGQTRKKNGYSQGNKRRVNSRTSRAQREDSIRRTVYVSDIDQQGAHVAQELGLNSGKSLRWQDPRGVPLR